MAGFLGRVRDLGRIFAREAGMAELARLASHGAEHAVERQIPEGLDPEMLADLLERMAGSDQLRLGRRVDAIVARARNRCGGDPEMHLLGTRLANHRDQLSARRAADERIVDDHNPLSLQYLAHRIEL